MSRYINPYTDFGFKRLFGEEANKDLLIDFLNTFLPEKHRIKTLNFRSAEHHGSISLDRKAVFDIYCEAENGERFIVEMQKAKQRWFKDRALFYVSYAIQDLAVQGEEWKFELQAIYFVGVLDFEFDEHEEFRKFQRDVHLKDQDGQLFYDKLCFIFLQMPLFTKTESELETRRDKWLYFLKNLESFEDIPAILREPVFERAFATAEVARMDKEQRFQYEMGRMVYWDNYAVMATAVEDGEERGMEIGMERGMEIGKTEGKIDVARNMKTKGFEIPLIAEMTGLSPEEIERLE